MQQRGSAWGSHRCDNGYRPAYLRRAIKRRRFAAKFPIPESGAIPNTHLPMENISKIEERYRTLPAFWHWITICFSIAGLALAVFQVFHLQAFGAMLMENSYLYLLLSFYLSMVFLFFPLRKGGHQRLVFIVDVILWLIAFSIPLYFAWLGYDIIERGWSYRAPSHMTAMAIILWVLVIEAVRRTSGTSLAVIILVFSLYPLFSPYMPGFLEGYGRSFNTTAVFHAFSIQSVLGIPMRVAGMILIGFIIFGVALQASGGGEFFLNLSYCILGATRGGTAKVAVLSSALFGSLSGSVISNVITTGSITIPAIKKSGYPAHYAGGIECAASTGGVLMPPVMGATAFVMAAFLSISYGKIALAAAIPSILAYLGLLVQVDGYSARKGLAGLPKSQIPSVRKVLAQGWFYLGAVAVLLYFLFALRLESQAPFISILFLLAFAMIRKETRFTLRSFLRFIQSTGKLLCELIAILSGVGMILGALALTGVAAAFAREIVSLAGGNLLFMLVLGAFTSFILGMGMTITACYVFLALVLAPALEMIGLNQIAVHLYIMYWGMLSYITPPVALAAYPAAVIAGSQPIKVGLMAMKLGAVKYLVPLFFVFDPALVMQAGTGAILQAFISASVGVILIGSVLEGYLIGIGKIELTTIGGMLSAAGLFAGGVMLSLPGLKMDFIGFGIAAATVCMMHMLRKANTSFTSST
ncbi:MAG: TRAP transporter fused permease subunit [Deltaproteobacteria bacterium]|nr:TRAP transporter fused permease subunit [Deltaproteobacteria bacterium]